MKKHKTPIKDLLRLEDEKPALEAIYLECGVATDQLCRDPDVLAKITDTFNRATGNNFTSETLLRYVFNRRKAADWPKLGKDAKKFRSVLHLLSNTEIEILKQLYHQVDETSDNLVCDQKLANEIADRFAETTGKRISATLIISTIVAKRKRGLWIKIREPFADMEAIAQHGA